MHHFRNTYPTNTNAVSGYLIPDDEDNNTLPLAEINIAALQLTAPTNLSTVSIPYSYRYGFNGQEHANELNSSTYDFGARMYDGRIGKMFSPDPREADYPWQSTYAYFGNSPIWMIDFNGEGNILGGVTTVFGEFEAGYGVAAGVNHVTQKGTIYDVVGVTKFKLQSNIYIVNQKRGENASKSVVWGISLSSSVGINHDWGSKSFYDKSSGNISSGIPTSKSPFTLPSKVKIADLIAIGITLGRKNFGIQVGLGVGFKISKTEATEWTSISITTDEKNKVKERFGTEKSWTVDEKIALPIYDEKKNIIGYSGAMYIGNDATGITLKSGVALDENKNIVSNGIWMSDSYIQKAKQRIEEVKK